MDKTCKKCGVTKPLAEFAANKKMADGYLSSCKLCRAEYNAEWWTTNKHRQREYDARRTNRSHGTPAQKQAYYAAHRAEILAKAKEQREAEYLVYVLRGIKARAKQRGQYFELTLSDLPELLDSCPICGRELAIAGDDRRASPSIDRIIPIRGYVSSNLTGWVCTSCNSRKHDRSLERLADGEAGDGWQRWAIAYLAQRPVRRVVRRRAHS